MTQTVQYVVDLKGAQEAQRELDRLNVAFDKNNSAAMSMDKAIAQMERDIKDLNAAIAAGGPNVVQYKRALKDLQTQAAQGAAGTRNMGQAALEASRGLEDLQYGLNGVINNIPSLVMALGGGAGLTAAISLGSVAINQIVKHSGDMIAEFNSGARDANAFAGNIRDMSASFDGILNKSLSKTKELLTEARDELREFGKVGREIRLQEASMEVDAQQGRLRRAEAFSDQNRARAAQMEEDFLARMQSTGHGGDFSWIAGAQDAIQTQKAIADQLDKRAKALIPAIENQKKELFEIQNINEQLAKKEALQKAAEEAEKQRKRGGKKDARDMEKEAEDLAKLKYDVYVAGLTSEDKALKEVNDARKRDAKMMAKEQKRDDKEREKQNEKTLKNIAKAERKHAEEQAQYATQAVSIVAGASTQLVSDMVSGQEQALERFGLSIMAQAGQALVSYGVQAIGRGVLEASNPITAPLAPASFAAGGALVVAGVGLGGVAGGVGSLMGNTGGGSDDKRSRRDPGASPRRGGGGGDGGPVVLNLTYGAAGPLPEDTARLISRELRTGAKRAGR